MTNTISTDVARSITVNLLARKLQIETLETRNSDRLDFHDLAVWEVKAALEAAFEAGRKYEQDHS